MEGIKRFLNFDNCVVAESVGKSEDLTFLWNQDIDLQIQSFSI